LDGLFDGKKFVVIFFERMKILGARGVKNLGKAFVEVTVELVFYAEEASY
jgi:hypothetical protein